MTFPNFLVIGAAKCGTDSLCNYLGQHPDVFVCPNREPSFFVAEGQDDVPYCGRGDRTSLERKGMWVSSRSEYESLFQSATTEKAIGEGTAWYIYYENAPARIARHIPSAKLIAVLRNPADRAYSAYTMLLRDGRESISNFADALDAEEERTRRNWEPIWHYIQMGFYTAQLERYYQVFDRSQIRVITYDDFNTDPVGVVKEVYEFLGVDPQFTPDATTRYNVSLVPKHLIMHTLVAGEHPIKKVLKTALPQGIRQALKQRVVQSNLRQPTAMEPEVRRRLVDVFRADVLQLQEMLGRDLSNWLN